MFHLHRITIGRRQPELSRFRWVQLRGPGHAVFDDSVHTAGELIAQAAPVREPRTAQR